MTKGRALMLSGVLLFFLTLLALSVQMWLNGYAYLNRNADEESGIGRNGPVDEQSGDEPEDVSVGDEFLVRSAPLPSEDPSFSPYPTVDEQIAEEKYGAMMAPIIRDFAMQAGRQMRNETGWAASHDRYIYAAGAMSRLKSRGTALRPGDQPGFEPGLRRARR